MGSGNDLEREVIELRNKLKHLTESAERRAWGNPHNFAYQALSSVELIRDYYASTAEGVELIRGIVERLRITAAGRVGSQSAGAPFIFGLADLIEGVYLENRYNEKVHAYAQQRKIEELRAQQSASKSNT